MRDSLKWGVALALCILAQLAIVDFVSLRIFGATVKIFYLMLQVGAEYYLGVGVLLIFKGGRPRTTRGLGIAGFASWVIGIVVLAILSARIH